MCFNCGCSNPDDDMGSAKNITNQTLTELSKHWGKSLGETKQQLFALLNNKDPSLEKDEHLSKMFSEAAQDWGQSVEEAKKNTLALLKNELH